MSTPADRSADREEAGEARLHDEFLAFLNSDRPEEGLSEAEVQHQRAKRYLDIQEKLARLFAWRGCYEQDDLARIALDRAESKWAEAHRSPDPAAKDKPNPVTFVCGFVRYVFLEWLAKRQAQTHTHAVEPPNESRSPEDDFRLECLESCMNEVLQPAERYLIIEYYKGEKVAKINSRKRMAEQLNFKTNTLRVECHRIRLRLRACVARCVELKQNNRISPI
jgi:DNA-directed RNA polymerase specialized sigma24 family protein